MNQPHIKTYTPCEDAEAGQSNSKKNPLLTWDKRLLSKKRKKKTNDHCSIRRKKCVGEGEHAGLIAPS